MDIRDSYQGYVVIDGRRTRFGNFDAFLYIVLTRADLCPPKYRELYEEIVAARRDFQAAKDAAAVAAGFKNFKEWERLPYPQDIPSIRAYNPLHDRYRDRVDAAYRKYWASFASHRKEHEYIEELAQGRGKMPGEILEVRVLNENSTDLRFPEETVEIWGFENGRTLEIHFTG